ncbi:unnamed protein product [Rotaria sp. Silwood2]|nr:unnamed protein product [Rotaria sp. Silwood2]
MQHDYLQKAICFADQATTEDKAYNYEAAAQHYMTAADWLMQTMKYGALNVQMKQVIRPKVESYVRRAEEIKEVLKNGSAKKKPIANTSNERGNAKDNKGNDDDENNRDVNRKLRLLKFEHAIVTDMKVTFDDVIGLEQAKEALKEAVILPVKFPQHFQGILLYNLYAFLMFFAVVLGKRKPWASILLYGPPGTGKSYLAKAVASECTRKFISVTSSDLLSKWFGESERNVKDLFEFARERQSCVVFIDNIDGLFGQCHDTESESLKRVKTEFLVQMQGVEKDNSGVFILATTNMPWALDTAIRRSFEKRIYISLPDVNERAALFKIHVGTNTYHTIQEHEWMQLAQKTEYYSGVDIAVICQEALLRPVRRLCSATHFKRVQNPKPNGPRQLWLVCSPEDPAAQELTLDKIKSDELYEPSVSMKDIEAALATQKPTVGKSD